MKLSRLFPLALLACLTTSAFAERADKDKPVNIEADKLTVNDKDKSQLFEGRVKLTQGTMQISASKVVVTQDANGFQKGVATGGEGGLARFKQKREGLDEYIEGEAERIEYEGKTDTAELFLRAFVKSGSDQVRGQYIRYNGVTETYLVTNGPNANVVPGTGRVTATIQPRRGNAQTPPASTKP